MTCYAAADNAEMCEWLCSREWCDVRLVCGAGSAGVVGGAGRALPAHRAVLASVSTFLRRILLSSPTEETPTLIVLPDFDLEAMSSVLYYIYNGEVVIQKHKLERFMEIVKAMQIFVDDRYLPTSCKSVENSSLCAQEYKQNLFESKAFHLGEGPFINLKKISHNGNTDNIDLNNHLRCEKKNDGCLGNEQSSFGNRQRSFLRDLFMETYPRNGNANGWQAARAAAAAAGVLAMPSALYRPPPSDPLTNANGIHLHNDTHSQMLNQPTDTLCVINYPQNLHRIQIPPKGSDKVTSTEYSRLAHSKKNASELLPTNLKNCDIAKSSFNSQWLSVMLKKYHNPSYDFLVSSSADIANTELLPNGLESPFNQCLIGSNKSDTGKIINVLPGNSSSPKGAILNQVLDSPWCNRQPTNYRPFKRKLQNSTDITSKDVRQKAFNDDNNNVQTSSTPDEVERLSANTLEKMYPAPSLLIGSDFKCTVCDQVFTDSETLAAHARRHSSVAKYSCTECSKSFSQLRNFKYHMSIHRGTREFAATCTVCGKYFNDRGYLSSHMKIHRNRKEYKCSQCPKSFNQRVAYNMHVRIHTGVKPHVCGECGKAFSRKMLLKQHLRTHSGERPYACAHCHKRFADRSNMTLHLRLHTGVKPFSCTLCPKSFTKKHHLKSHLNFHTGAKPYSCPKCKLAFTQSSNMRTHLKKCTAPDPVEKAEMSASN